MTRPPLDPDNEAAAANLTTAPRAAALRRRLAHIVGTTAVRVPPLVVGATATATATATAAAVASAPSASARREQRQLALRSCAAATASTSTSVVVGGMILDVLAAPAAGSTVRRGTSVPGRVHQTPGGVGRNIAEGLRRMSPAGAPPPLLVSAVGDDLAGVALTKAWSDLGASVAAVRVCAGAATPAVVAVLDGGGEVAAAVADTATAEQGLDAAWVGRFEDDIASAAVVVLDGNCTPDVLAAAAAAAAATTTATTTTSATTKMMRVPRQQPPPPPPPSSLSSPPAGTTRLWFEPVSVAKSVRAGAAGILPLLDFISPNAGELRAMANEVRSRRGERRVRSHGSPLAPSSPSSSSSPSPELFSSSPHAGVDAMTREDIAVMLREGVKHVVLTVGAAGVILSKRIDASARERYGNDNNNTATTMASTVTGGRDGGGGGASGRGVRGVASSPASEAAAAAVDHDDDARGFAVLHRHFPALPADVVSLVGAGDSLVAGCCAALLAGLEVEPAVAMGMAAARRAIETAANVPAGAAVDFEALSRDAGEVLARVSTVAARRPPTRQLAGCG